FYQRTGAVLALLLLLAVWLRFRRATRAERRSLAPLWVAVCVIALVYLMGAFASPFPLADPFGYLIWELQGALQISLPVIFVWGLLSARIARRAVGDLVVELDRPLIPGELQVSLARTLGDPSLELRNPWRTSRSTPEPPAHGSRCRAATGPCASRSWTTGSA